MPSGSVNMILPDLLIGNLKLVICGTAAGNKSAEKKAYYAGRGNLFYQTLARSGFTSILLSPDQFPELLNYGIGLTDLAKFTFGLDSSLKSDDYDVQSFEEKIQKFQPLMVCFNGKTAAAVYFGIKKTTLINYGLQTKTIGKTKIFVAPSTSPKAFASWDEEYWRKLNELIINTF